MKKACLITLSVLSLYAATPSEDAVEAIKKGDLALFQKAVTDIGGANSSLQNGKTILMYAVWEGREDIAKYLISKGADVNAKDKEGKTALMLAIWRERLNLVKLLIQNKADTGIKNVEGLAAKDIAELTGNGELIDFFASTGG